MSKSISSKITIFLSTDQKALEGYFNHHDPAPIYKRQLSHVFEQYIMASLLGIKRYSVINYKVCYKTDRDKEYIDPLMYAIRGHFTEQKLLRMAAFEKFKRRTYGLLIVSICIVMACQGLTSLLSGVLKELHTGLSNSLDVFSWVVLWRPIDLLLFSWNPHLKDISIMDRLANAEIILVNHEE